MSFFRVMSFNVLENSEDMELSAGSPEHWQNRSEFNIQTIQRYRPDLIGFQEFGPMHLESYQERFPGYELCAGSKFFAVNSNAIFYKAVTFDLLHQGEFFLTRTPDRPDPDWGLEYALGVNWMILRERESGAPILFMNTQYEDGGAPEQFLMRQEGCQIHLKQMEAVLRLAPAAPVVLMGDFNFHAWSWHYRYFIEHGFVDTYRAAGLPEDIDSSTFHGFRGKNYFALDYGATLAWRVDWILYRDGAAGGPKLQTLSGAVARDVLLREGQEPIYPSDHYPMMAELII